MARALVWHGTARWVAIPMPSSQVRIDIGAVQAGEGTTDFSVQLPAAPGDRAQLSWLGGSYLDPTGNDDVAGFRVYGETAPGNGIDYTGALAEIIAYPGGILTDGFGRGGFGRLRPRCTSGRAPCPGIGHLVIRGRLGRRRGQPGCSGRDVDHHLLRPPRPPAAFADGSRLKSTYNPTARTMTLS